jgi:hypothetical protein
MAKEKMYEVKSLTDRWCLARGEELPGDLLSFTLVDEPTQKGIMGSANWREVIEETEFTCPKCGSHMFGTGTSQGVSAVRTTSIDGQYMGFCHGRVPLDEAPHGRHHTVGTKACDFTWPRTDEEDAKVFKGTGHYSPRICEGVVVVDRQP